MRTLPRPSHTAREAFTLCVSRVRRRALRRRLLAVVANVEAGEDEYVQKGETAALHTFPRIAAVGRVTAKEMVKVYTGRFVPQDCDARSIYDEIIAAAPRGRCPICGVGQVATLDHHLPKTEYPLLAVTPVNLVPACSWCQTCKRQEFPTTAEEQTLHPYFDDFEAERWLFAEVAEIEPATFSFFVRRPEGWTDLNVARLENHLKTFELPRLFASNAADELINIRYSLSELYNTGGAQAVCTHLSGEADSREEAFKNSWQTAMYRAAEGSEWFCDGGFSFE